MPAATEAADAANGSQCPEEGFGVGVPFLFLILGSLVGRVCISFRRPLPPLTCLVDAPLEGSTLALIAPLSRAAWAACVREREAPN
jgi:hypothetical protein